LAGTLPRSEQLYLEPAYRKYQEQVLCQGKCGDATIQDRFLDTPLAGVSHVFGGGIALLLGPFQLNGRFRARHLRLHRWTGRVYLTAVLAPGLAGLYLATVTYSGFSSDDEE